MINNLIILSLMSFGNDATYFAIEKDHLEQILPKIEKAGLEYKIGENFEENLSEIAQDFFLIERPELYAILEETKTEVPKPKEIYLKDNRNNFYKSPTLKNRLYNRKTRP